VAAYLRPDYVGDWELAPISSSVKQDWLKVAKTSSGPFPRSFWISNAKKNNNFIKKKNQNAYFVTRLSMTFSDPFNHPSP
jgi:hypothetical protein